MIINLHTLFPLHIFISVENNVMSKNVAGENHAKSSVAVELESLKATTLYNNNHTCSLIRLCNQFQSEAKNIT